MPDYRLFAVENRLSHKLNGINLERDRETVSLWQGVTRALGNDHDGWGIPDCADENLWDRQRLVITRDDSHGWVSLFKDESRICYSLDGFSDRQDVLIHSDNPPAPGGKVKLTINADNSLLIEAYTPPPFELVTWYNAWNEGGLNNLKNKLVPLNFATRYNIASGDLVDKGSGYTIGMFGLAAAVKEQILSQAPGAVVFAGLTQKGMQDAVNDNKANQNRSTKNIVKWLLANGYGGISINVEELPDKNGTRMPYVVEFIAQLGASFKAAKLLIAVSVPWPGMGPKQLYGDNAVKIFNEFVDAAELQDYSLKMGTPWDAKFWVAAGVKPSILLGGVSTENGENQTSITDTYTWTQYAVQNGLRGMFSWRLDNDHGMEGDKEDVKPTFSGARTVYKAANGWDNKFQGRPAVFPITVDGGFRSINVLTASGRLAQLWDVNLGYATFWNFAFPAEIAGHGDLRFQGGPCAVPTDAANNKAYLYSITTDGRLVQVWNTDKWDLNFPAANSGLRFQTGVVPFQTDLTALGKLHGIVAVDSNGELECVAATEQGKWTWFPFFTSAWPRWQGIPAAFSTILPPVNTYMYTVTNEGRLMQVYDWRGETRSDFPAEEAGWNSNKRFQTGVAVYPTDLKNVKKAIYAVTADGELVRVWDDTAWHFEVIQGIPQLQGIPAAFPRVPNSSHAYVYAVSRDNKLVRVTPTAGGGWSCEYLFEKGLQCQGSPSGFMKPDGNVCIYVLTTDGRLAQVWNDPNWRYDFPADQV